MTAEPEIIYQDQDLIIVNKPAGWLSIPDRFELDKSNLHHWLEKRLDTKVWTVHRLDKETTGVICFALNEDAHRNLSLQFEDRNVQKIYLALVDGRIAASEGQIDKGIAPHPGVAGKMITTAKGKNALTLFRVIEVFKSFSLAEADIKTGRTHQVRVHFQAIGHPLAIDPLYGRRSELFLSEIKGKNFRLGKFEEERPLMSRTTLHAFKLTLQHPSTGEIRQFEAPLPKDFYAILQQLRKWASV